MLHVYTLFRKIWETEILQDRKSKATWSSYQRKESRKNAKTGEASLLSTHAKVSNRIIMEQLMMNINKRLRREQTGSCRDQIVALHILTEKSQEWNSLQCYDVTFVDFEKAFDSIDRSTLWKILYHHGIPRKFMDLLRATYEPSTYRVVHGHWLILFQSPWQCNWHSSRLLISLFHFLVVIHWIMEWTVSGPWPHTLKTSTLLMTPQPHTGKHAFRTASQTRLRLTRLSIWLKVTY
jgi:hypothetical protein